MDEFLAFGGYANQILMFSGVTILTGVGLNFILGFGGLFAMGQAGFMAIGAYSGSLLLLSFPQSVSWLGPIAAPLLGGALSSAFAAACAPFLLRLRGDALAVATLGLGEVVRIAFLQIDAVGGARGLPGIPSNVSLSTVALWGSLGIGTSLALLRTRLGRAWLALRDDPLAARSLGIAERPALTAAFAFGAFFAGVSGALFAQILGYIHPSNFDFNRSFEAIVVCVLGGLGSVPGVVLAATSVTVLKEALRPLQELTQIDFRTLFYAAILIFFMLFRPRGLFKPSRFGGRSA